MKYENPDMVIIMLDYDEVIQTSTLIGKEQPIPDPNVGLDDFKPQ